MNDREALKIHGFVYSDDSDSGLSEFDDQYFKHKPPALKIDPYRRVIIEPKENVDILCDKNKRHNTVLITPSTKNNNQKQRNRSRSRGRNRNRGKSPKKIDKNISTGNTNNFVTINGNTKTIENQKLDTYNFGETTTIGAVCQAQNKYLTEIPKMNLNFVPVTNNSEQLSTNNSVYTGNSASSQNVISTISGSIDLVNYQLDIFKHKTHQNQRNVINYRNEETGSIYRNGTNEGLNISNFNNPFMQVNKSIHMTNSNSQINMSQNIVASIDWQQSPQWNSYSTLSNNKSVSQHLIKSISDTVVVKSNNSPILQHKKAEPKIGLKNKKTESIRNNTKQELQSVIKEEPTVHNFEYIPPSKRSNRSIRNKTNQESQSVIKEEPKVHNSKYIPPSKRLNGQLKNNSQEGKKGVPNIIQEDRTAQWVLSSSRNDTVISDRNATNDLVWVTGDGQRNSVNELIPNSTRNEDNCFVNFIKCLCCLC